MKIRTPKEYKEEIEKTKMEIFGLASGLDTSLLGGVEKSWWKRNIVKIVLYGMYAVIIIFSYLMGWYSIIVIIGLMFVIQLVMNLYYWIKGKFVK